MENKSYTPEKDDHEHCWHFTGLVLTSMPPQYEQICCWCGKKRNVEETRFEEGLHGSFKPKM